MIYKFRDVQSHQAVPLPPGEYLIGREDECPIHIENTSVSRRHARITNSEQGVILEDLGSSNGTAIGGQLLTGPTPLQVNEVVYFGTVCYRLEPEVGGETATPEPTPMTGLKPVGLRNSLHKATDRVPLGSIRFDTVPVPAIVPAPETPAPTPPATTKPVEEVKPVTRQKFSSYPTITLPATATTQTSPARTVEAPAVTPTPSLAAAPVTAPARAPLPVVESTPAVPWGLTLTLAFGAGVAVGLIAGIAGAYYLFHIAKPIAG